MLESQLPYRVIVHNDEDHSYEYVIRAFMTELRMPRHGALELAQEVDQSGHVSIPVADLTAAQALQERLFSYGPDPLVRRRHSQASLMIAIEERVGAGSQVVGCGRVSLEKGYERLAPEDVRRIQEATRAVPAGSVDCPRWFYAIFLLIAVVVFTGSLLALAVASHRVGP